MRPLRLSTASLATALAQPFGGRRRPADRTTTPRKGRAGGRRLAGFAVLAVLLAALVAAPAQANHPGPPSGDGIQPVFTLDNPTCAALDPGKLELRVQPVADGTFTDGFLTVTIDVRDTAGGQVFDWTSNIGVDSIFVKGGPDGNFYTYDPPAEDTEDTSLHAPINHSNDVFFGLSHISFCYDVRASIKVEKSGDELSKVGDSVKYDFTITNDGDIPLTLDSVTDTLLGSLTATASASGCGSLAAGASCTFSVNRTVQPGDPDPLPNTVTVHYSGTLPTGATTVTDSDDHSVNLFQPAIAVDKTGDELSKVGDSVSYEFTFSNNSSADTPALDCTAEDDVLGTVFDGVLPLGDTVVNKSRTVQAGDPDPLVNTVTLTCSPAGFPNVLEASDSHSVNLFQPSLEVEKSADNGFSKSGDSIEYTVTIKNTSSADSPALVFDAITDSIQGDLTDPVNVDSSTCGATLASGVSCVIVYTHLVSEPPDADPLVNTVSVQTHPAGFPNDVDDSASATVDLLHPAYTVTKDCKAGTEPVPQEGPALFTITFANTGDADLVITADDGVGTFNLAAGATQSFTHSVSGPFSGQATVENTVHSTAVLDPKYGLPNTFAKDASGDCRVGSRVNVLKLTNGVVNSSQSWSFAIFNNGPHADDSDSSFLGSPIATANTLGDADGILFGNVNLDPTETYTLCELGVPAGWTVIWMVDRDGDGVAETMVTPFNPNAKDTPPESLGNQCFDFGAGTSDPLAAGGTLVFKIDNTFPGGQPRTIGYWKNWNTCTGGNQAATAAKNGGAAAGFFLLDDVLNDPGITIGSYTIPGATTVESGTNKTGCQIAVLLLGKSDKVTGRNKANDAAYELAAQLIAAKANQTAGAETCPALTQAILDADALLASIGFNGTGDYLGPKVKGALATKRAQALALAATLDQYNNGDLC
ncbi:MAG TPA: hypothetical protein VFN99_05810 [Gaiella sp.]|nr:hypothetical protein [Gaiella sp.]